MQAHKQILAGVGLVLMAACATNPSSMPPQGDAGGNTRPLPSRVSVPFYPETMLRHGEEADVDIGCNVDATGRTQDCQVLSQTGNPDAAKAALAYVAHARYRPRTRNSVPISSYHTWHIHYRVGPPTPASHT